MPLMRKTAALAANSVAYHDVRRAPRPTLHTQHVMRPGMKSRNDESGAHSFVTSFAVTASGRAPARMFHVERSCQHRERRDLWPGDQTPGAACQRRVGESAKVFHVEHSFQVRNCRGSPIDQGFRAPTRRRRLKEFGTAIGSCHSQKEIFRISGSSWDPIHKTAVLVPSCSECAQSKNAG